MSFLDSGRTNLLSLFTSRSFAIPPYQRFYAWEQDQWDEFLDDIANVPEGRNYFLGTLLFMSSPDGGKPVDGVGSEVFHVVDGQQRLTTVVLFLNALRHTHPALLKPRDIRTYLFDEDVGAYKFQSTPEDWPLFRALLDLGEREAVLPPAETPSQKRLRSADAHFQSVFAQKDDAVLQRWLQTLSNSTVLVHAVDGYGEASMIFETVNDRGKRLTDLESLKSFLMHIIGQTRRSAQAEQQAVDSLQGNFSTIYRMINRFERQLDEDAALRQCYFLFPRPLGESLYPYWNGEGNAKDDAKTWLLKLVREGHTQTAFDAALALSQHIHTYFQRIESLVSNSFAWEEVDRLWILRRIANFWPILLSAYPANSAAQAEYRSILRLCEVASVKIWGIGDFRADKAQTNLIRIAQECVDDPHEILPRLTTLLKWWEIPRRWEDGLNNPLFYQQGRDARYVLFEYENHLRVRMGFPIIPYNDFDEMTIEHIAAQKGAEVEKALLDLSVENCPHSVDGPPKTTPEGSVATPISLLHHIGNLVVDPQPSNSRKHSLEVRRKLPWFNAAPYLSQTELEDDLQSNDLIWNAHLIQTRGDRLIAFARKRWDEDLIHSAGVELAPSVAVGEK